MRCRGGGQEARGRRGVVTGEFFKTPRSVFRIPRMPMLDGTGASRVRS